MRIGHAEEMMPEVVVYLLEGRTLDAKRSRVKDITDAVVKNLGAPPEAVTVSLVETPKTAKGKGGVAASCSAICRHALRATRFQLYLFGGARSFRKPVGAPDQVSGRLLPDLAPGRAGSFA